MLATNLQIRHSRAGGNPAKTNNLQGRPNRMLSCCAGAYLNIWIPACAGMTPEGK
jgi:hypothetical protein